MLCECTHSPLNSRKISSAYQCYQQTCCHCAQFQKFCYAEHRLVCLWKSCSWKITFQLSKVGVTCERNTLFCDIGHQSKTTYCLNCFSIVSNTIWRIVCVCGRTQRRRICPKSRLWSKRNVVSYWKKTLLCWIECLLLHEIIAGCLSQNSSGIIMTPLHFKPYTGPYSSLLGAFIQKSEHFVCGLYLH